MTRGGDWRHLVLVAIPITAAIGPYLVPVGVAGVSIYGFRMLVLALTLLFPVLGQAWRADRGTANWFLAVVGFWLTWGVASLLWTPDLGAGMNDVLAIAFGGLVVWIVLMLTDTVPDRVDAIRTGWTLAYVVTAAIVTWELVSGQHLPSSFTETKPDYIIRVSVLATFGNPNNLAAFLLLCAPFLWWGATEAETRPARWRAALLFGGLPFLLVAAGGRLALLGFVCQMLLLAMLRMQNPRAWVRGALVFTIIAIVAALAFRERIEMLYKVAQLAAEFRGEGSGSTRMALTLDGFWMLGSTAGMGVGAGGFPHVMAHAVLPYPVNEVVDPHNFWIEIAAQFGAVVAVAVMAWMLVTLRRVLSQAWDARHQWGMRGPAEAMAMGVVGYFFAAMENSAYLRQPTNWAFLASAVGVITVLERRRRARKTPPAWGPERSGG